MVHYQDIVGKPNKGRAAGYTADLVMTLDSPQIIIMDATAAARQVTPPQTKVPGLVYTIKKQDSTANVITINGTFNGLTNLKLYGQNQWYMVSTTTTVGNFAIIAFGSVNVPAGTASTNLPEGIEFNEY